MNQTVGWPPTPPEEPILVKLGGLDELTITPDGEGRWLVDHRDGMPPSVIERVGGRYEIHAGPGFWSCSSWEDIWVGGI